MRINHNVSALNTYNRLGANQGAAAKNMEKLSSGLRINRAGDDAAGLAISEKMRAQVRGLDMATKNANDSISLIQTAEGALNETHSIIQRMRELAVQATNDTNTDSDRLELQAEITQLISEIDRIGNTTEFNTKKLLDGSAKGIVNERDGSLIVNNNSRLTLDQTALQTIQALAKENASVNGSYTVIKSEESNDLNLYRVFDTDGNEIINYGALAERDLTTAINGLNDLSGMGLTSSLGTSSQQILSNAFTGLYSGATGGLISGGYDAAKLALKKELDEFQKFSTALTDLKGTFEQALKNSNAAGLSAGNTAIIQSSLMIINANIKNFDDGIALMQTAYDTIFTADKLDPNQSATIKSTLSNLRTDLSNNWTSAIANGLPSGILPNEITNIETRLTSSIDATRDNNIRKQAEVRVSGDQIYFNKFTAFGKEETSLQIKNLDKLDKDNGMKVGESVTLVFGEKVDAEANVDESILTQIGANGGQTAFISMNDMRAKALDIDSIDVTDKFKASAAIEKVNAALTKVSAQRSSLGAVQNRLEHTINNLTASSENLTSAESRIRDVDMAKEMMDLTKNNILSQAAQAMLAQANQTPQGVLQLLG